MKQASSIFPTRFNCCILRQFRTSTNIQELEVDRLSISKFMPRLRRYFGHFLLTLRSLAPRKPRGCHRQIFYFIGQFQHLDNLKIVFRCKHRFPEPANCLKFVPPLIPPLRGQLTMTSVNRLIILKGMIELFGRIRLHRMDLFNVDRTLPLLDACEETLEILRLYPTARPGE